MCVVAAVVQSKCEPVLERFNFRWPGVLDCARLPDGAADNSQLCIDPPSPGDQLDDALNYTQSRVDIRLRLAGRCCPLVSQS